MRIFWLCVLTVGLVSSTAMADEKTKISPKEGDGEGLSEFEKTLKAEGVELDDLKQTTVTATRSQQRTIESDRSVNVVLRQNMREMQSTSVPDALSESTGIVVQTTNRSAGAPIIRGFVGPQNLLLIDGVRLNTSVYRTGPLQYLNITDPFAFARIEVVRGPGSVLFGSDSFGGTVQMLTDELDFKRSFSMTGTLGTFSADHSFIGNAGATVAHGNFAAAFGFGYKRFGVLRTGNNEFSPESDNDALAARAKIGYRLSDKLMLSAAYLGTLVNNAARIDKLYNGDWRRNDNSDHLAYVRARYSAPSAIFSDLTATLSFHQMGEHFDRYSCSSTDGIVSDLAGCTSADDLAPGKANSVNRYRTADDTVNTIGGSVTSSFRFLGGKLVSTAGAETYWERISSAATDAKQADSFAIKSATPNYREGSTFLRVGAFAHARYVPITFGKTWQLVVNGGVRLAHARLSAPDVQLGTEVKDVNQSFTAVIGTGGLMLSKEDTLGIYVNVAQGFRAPNMQEATQLGDTGAFFAVPNASLNPEKILSIELGTKLSVGPLTMAVALFDAELTDVIVWKNSTFNGATEVDGKPVLSRRNAGSGRHLGGEATISVKLGGLKLFGNAAYTKGDVENVNGVDEPGRFVPGLSYLAGARYARAGKAWYARWYAQVHVQGIAPQERLAPGTKKDVRTCGSTVTPGVIADPCTRIPPWATLNARGGMLFSDHLWADLSLTNLTDWRYKTQNSGVWFPGFGLAFTLTATY